MRGYKFTSLTTERTTARAAVCTPNGVTNATLTVTAATAGTAGNNLSIKCVNGTGADSALAAAIASNVITVTLGTDAEEAPDDTKNTGTLVAAAVDALSEVTCDTSGTGAGVVAAFAQQSLTGGHDVWSVSRTAKESNTSDLLIRSLERGGNCDPQEAARIANCLGTTVGALGSAL